LLEGFLLAFLDDRRAVLDVRAFLLIDTPEVAQEKPPPHWLNLAFDVCDR
jgi:hypothetical protein